MSLRTRGRIVVVSLIAVAVATAGTTVAQGTTGGGHHHQHKQPRITVMTQNLYLGSSLTPALNATTDVEFLFAVAEIFDTAVHTDFPSRAEALADTIATKRPDLVGLQEVTNWIAAATPLAPPEADPPSYDFLEILQGELAERGLDYEVAAVSQNIDTGLVPLYAPDFDCGLPSSATTPQCVVTLQDRDVILVNDDTRGLKVLRARTGDFVAQQEFQPPGATEPVSFARGWAYVNAKYRGTKFRFITTHLEVEDFAAVQEAQAAEFLAGPARSHRPVIATGDFNSAADPATTDTPTTTYADLTASWFKDSWAVNGANPGFTCCQSSALTNMASGLSKRIDLVLTHGKVRTRRAALVSNHRIGSVQPLWASDHAGVVAVLRLHRHRGH